MGNFAIVRAAKKRRTSLRDVEKEAWLTPSQRRDAETLLVYLEPKRSWNPKFKKISLYPCRVQNSGARPIQQFLCKQIYVVTTEHPKTCLPAGESSEHAPTH